MTWMIRVKKYMKDLNLQNKIVENQKEWRRRIHVKDH